MTSTLETQQSYEDFLVEAVCSADLDALMEHRIDRRLGFLVAFLHPGHPGICVLPHELGEIFQLWTRWVEGNYFSIGDFVRDVVSEVLTEETEGEHTP